MCFASMIPHNIIRADETQVEMIQMKSSRLPAILHFILVRFRDPLRDSNFGTGNEIRFGCPGRIRGPAIRRLFRMNKNSCYRLLTLDTRELTGVEFKCAVDWLARGSRRTRHLAGKHNINTQLRLLHTGFCLPNYFTTVALLTYLRKQLHISLNVGGL